MIRRSAGVTILEAMLVLVIGSLIIYLSINQYLSYRYDADIAQVNANVNTIFQAMTDYYKQNCYGVITGTNDTLQPGELNPANSAVGSNTTKYISIPANLIANGFLNKTDIPASPIVNPSGAGWNGYVAQFNRTSSRRMVCKSGNGAVTGPYDKNCSSTIDVGEVVIWMAQVAVKLHDTAHAKVYLHLLGGDCLSNASGNTVTPCVAGSTGSGSYVVWSRLPINANTGATSDYWLTTPTVSTFTQMYRTLPTLYLTNGSATTEQYYLCGN